MSKVIDRNVLQVFVPRSETEALPGEDKLVAGRRRALARMRYMKEAGLNTTHYFIGGPFRASGGEIWTLGEHPLELSE